MWRRTWMFGWASATVLGLWVGSQLVVADQPATESGTAATMDATAPDCVASAANYKVVQKTICVPEITMERRTVKCMECKPEIRECQTTIVRKIPHTTWCEKECCVMVPKTCSRTECYTVCRPIIEKKQICYTASVPVHCTTPCTRCVCRPVPTKEVRTKCVDEGHWVDQCCSPPPCPCKHHCKKDCCEPECCQPCTKKVWIPNMVEKQFSVTVWKPEWKTENYNKVTTTFKCEPRTATVNCIKGYTKECKTREVYYTVCEQKTVVKKIPHTTYTCEEVPFTKRYTVMVPQCVEKEIMVPVCKMVTKTIDCKVPCCN